MVEQSGPATETVISNLFETMERTVKSYGPGAVKVHRRIEGTAFFPGGIGLWRGLDPYGEALFGFPTSPVMILGHNFDKVAGLEASWKRGVEKMAGATWLILRRYLQTAGVDESECFFTNVLVGLQPLKSPGKMVADDDYYEECRTFLHEQIRLIKPRLVATLGKPAKAQYLLSACDTPYVGLVHPMYPFTLGRNGDKCAEIVVAEAAKLRDAINELA
jgi:uracil-DNA glycosylase family 4